MDGRRLYGVMWRVVRCWRALLVVLVVVGVGLGAWKLNDARVAAVERAVAAESVVQVFTYLAMCACLVAADELDLDVTYSGGVATIPRETCVEIIERGVAVAGEGSVKLVVNEWPDWGLTIRGGR